MLLTAMTWQFKERAWCRGAWNMVTVHTTTAFRLIEHLWVTKLVRCFSSPVYHYLNLTTRQGGSSCTSGRSRIVRKIYSLGREYIRPPWQRPHPVPCL